ncbi:CLUMA_CG004169, isoform A [Clunio marinus]|uniref:Peptide deformylase n=1 Tax=Clunio marinus TaxID=568069 RepID=A0A1J1HVD8_9DIPT|nr:CLUMA_CG004169, isoform A [Clunio marinus]
MFKVERNMPPWGHCVQIGDPVLREIADEVPKELIKSPEIQYLIKQMKVVLKDYRLVGIAAPQIGISLRIILMFCGEHLKDVITPETFKAREMSTFPLTVFINPELEVVDHRKIIIEETCASVVGFVAEVPRNYSVKVKAFDRNGKEFQHTFTGWNARIVQHEIDHLNGILFTDLMNRKSFRCTNWEIVNRKAGRIVIPFYPKK